MFSQYLRLGVNIHAPDRAVIRAAALLLHLDVRRERRLRFSRKKFYREMLAHHARARKLARDWRL